MQPQVEGERTNIFKYLVCTLQFMYIILCIKLLCLLNTQFFVVVVCIFLNLKDGAMAPIYLGWLLRGLSEIL